MLTILSNALTSPFRSSVSFFLLTLQCLIMLNYSTRISRSGTCPRQLTCIAVRFNSPVLQHFLFSKTFPIFLLCFSPKSMLTILSRSHFSSLLVCSFLFVDSAVFYGATAFNTDISKWEVSKVVSMTSSPFQFIYFIFNDYLLCSTFSSFFCSNIFHDLSFSHSLTSPLCSSLSLFLFLTLQCLIQLMHSTRTSRNGRCPK